MKLPGAKYRQKRNRILAGYVLTLVGSFLLSTVFIALWESLGWEILYGIFMTLIMVSALCVIGMVPVAIWALRQSLKAKEEDLLFIERQQQPVKELVDAAGERIKIVRRPCATTVGGC